MIGIVNARDLACESTKLLMVSILGSNGNSLLVILLQMVLDGNQEERRWGDNDLCARSTRYNEVTVNDQPARIRYPVLLYSSRQ
jgi:hypothetical protein